MPAGRSHVPVPAGRAGERRHRERAPGPDLSHPVRDKAVLGNRGQDGSPLHFAATDGFSLSGLSSMPRLTLRAATALPLVKLDVNPKKQGLPEPAPAILGSGVGHRRPNQRIAHRSRSRSADFRLPAPNSTALSGGRALLRPPGTSGMTGAPGRSIRPGRRSYPASWRARREIHRRSGGGSAARCAGRPVSQGRRTGWQPHPERPRENRCRIAAPYPFRRTGPSGTRRPPRLRGACSERRWPSGSSPAAGRPFCKGRVVSRRPQRPLRRRPHPRPPPHQPALCGCISRILRIDARLFGDPAADFRPTSAAGAASAPIFPGLPV